MTWKLTRSLSFKHIEQQLIQLRDRLSEQGKTADEFYVDICCSWRSKLQSIDLWTTIEGVSGHFPRCTKNYPKNTKAASIP